MDLQALVDRHRINASSQAPANLQKISPSMRDFARYVTTQRAELAVIAELRREDPDLGTLGRVPDAGVFATSAETGGAYGVSMCIEPAWAGTLLDVRAASAVCGVPVLARGIVLDENDLYRAREAGADAVIVYAALHDAARLTALRKACRSMHMEAVVEAADEASLARAIEAEVPVIGVSGVGADGRPDLRRAGELLAKIPKGRVPVLCGGIASPVDLAPLLSLVDAVILMEAVMAVEPDSVGSVVEPFTTLV